MKETKNTLPMDFSVVSQPYTVLNHLNTVKEMSKEAVCLSDKLFEQINKEYKVFQERTIENSPVMFHGWEVDVDPEDESSVETMVREVSDTREELRALAEHPPQWSAKL